MAKRGFGIFLFMSMLNFLGCTKGVPDISSLRELNGFTLDQNTITITSKLTPSFPISGRCHANFNDVEISMDGGSQWMPLSIVATTHAIDCSTAGTFKASLTFAAKPLDKSKWSSAGTYNELMVRGISELGQSSALPLYLTNQGLELGRITAGGSQGPMTGGAFKLQGQISTLDSAPTISGGNFKLQGEVLW